MKKNISSASGGNLILHWLWRISFAVLLCTVQIFAQQGQQPPPEFPLGTWATGAPEDEPNQYTAIENAGFNWVVQGVYPSNKSMLQNFQIITQNSKVGEWVYHYSNGKYKRWEAERDEYAFLVTGFKHPHDNWNQNKGYLYGQVEEYLGSTCWSTTVSNPFPVDSVLWGPNYTQDKKYKSLDQLYNGTPIKYTVRYRLALTNAPQPTDTVCKLYVRYRCAKKENGQVVNIEEKCFDSLYLTTADLPGDTFHVKSLNGYIYPEQYRDQTIAQRWSNPNLSGTYYEDIDTLMGIEYCVKWYGNGKLYIDYVEVFDDDHDPPSQVEGIWKQWLTDPQAVSNRIGAYLSTYSDWPNIRYWYVLDEPGSLDAFEPIRIIDSLVFRYSGRRVITQLHPHWNGYWNGDISVQKFVELTGTDRVMMDYFPFWENETAEYGFTYIRPVLQLTEEYSPNFYYVPQGFGQFIASNQPPYFQVSCGWREPDSSELKASIFLALAHGTKGIQIWKFATDLNVAGAGNCDYDVQFRCLAKGTEDNYELYPLGQMINDNVAPRLNGKLGQTLLTLNYTEDYINMLKHTGDGSLPDQIWRYLRLHDFGNDYYWHAGFLQQNNQPENDYFMLVNLRVDGDRTARMTIENATTYENLCVRNIELGEGELDTTLARGTMITFDNEFAAGEGKLFQVAPVIKYGGKLCYNETVPNGTTLYDNMIIQNGATLTVAGNYTANADIIVRNGSIVTTGNGTIRFQGGHKLIIEGTAAINGTSSNKLTLDFAAPVDNNGIIIERDGSLNISYCVVKNAEVGIKAELYADYLNAQYVDFTDCESSSVTILGNMGGGETPPPQIKYCNISNSTYGISASNLSQLIIQQDTIMNTSQGIVLSNVTSANIINNRIISGTPVNAGIFLESCGGVVRGNTITGHTHAIFLGNSSPDIGGNTITGNWNRGIYVGYGSLPNMIGRLYLNPPLYYAISGYNKIYENGGWLEEDDGSEIYLYNSNVQMKGGCNQVTDQRIPNTGETPPLYNTQLLMNGDGFGEQIVVYAGGNFWDEHPIYPLEERFGEDLIMYLDPILAEPCPEPDQGGGEGLFIMSYSGEIIDTIYSVEKNLGTLTSTDLLYANAEEKFITADYDEAETIYNQIVNGNDSLTSKLDAYRRLYEIGKLTSKPKAYFNNLKTVFSLISQTIVDSIQKKIFSQLATLSLIGEEEYIPAIGEFDEIIQQNPNTEEAVYAEIDAITTALLIEGDSTLGKGALGKYLVKTGEDYLSKLDGILRKHFGNQKGETEEELLPKEYTLYQNYPNPFNPVTTIKYDLPEASPKSSPKERTLVNLSVYDILGRKVRTLVNEHQQAGRYEVKFNASNLASGVYLYQIRAEDFVSTKKMILLK